MSVWRLFAIGFVVVCTAIAWGILGGTIVNRTGEFDQRLAQEVSRLWGGRHEQSAPRAWYESAREVVEQQEVQVGDKLVKRAVKRVEHDQIPLPLARSRVRVGLALDQRRKGLLWYDTYAVTFAGRYKVRNDSDAARTAYVLFTFPSQEAIYDGFAFRVNGQTAPPVTDLGAGTRVAVALAAGAEAEVEVDYRSRGLGDWTYAFGQGGVAQVNDFELQATTDFDAIDFPAGTISPTRKERTGGGWTLTWAFGSLVTGQKVGIDAPDRLNPGPLAARITFFAPVSLLFFFTVQVMLGILRGRNLHPMNYFFLAAAFFSFHLLLAYLVDHFDVHASFLIAAATSILLVVTYLRLVSGWRAALIEAGVAQLVFLVLFSYAFFFEGYSGLTVTVGAVLTLFVLMQLTGRLNWEKVFNRGAAE